MARDLVRPAGGSREQECLGKSLDRMTTFIEEQMSQRVQDPEVMVELNGKKRSRLQVMEPEGSLSGTSNVAGKVAREVERLNMLLGRKEGEAESGRKNATIRVVRVAGRGRSRVKKEEGAIECARIEDMIARMK